MQGPGGGGGGGGQGGLLQARNDMGSMLLFRAYLASRPGVHLAGHSRGLFKNSYRQRSAAWHGALIPGCT